MSVAVNRTYSLIWWYRSIPQKEQHVTTNLGVFLFQDYSQVDVFFQYRVYIVTSVLQCGRCYAVL